MNIITPQEYTMNIMHQIPDIENGNKYEVMNHKLKIYYERLVKIEQKIDDKFSCCYHLSSFVRFAEGVCIWTILIMLWIKVMN
jgi:hypothetical protein